MTMNTVKINTPPPYLTLARNEELPVVMTVAGSDPSGGAGVEADIKTITAHRCYGMTCFSALTAQTPACVYDVHEIPKEFFAKILDGNLRDMKCDVIKTGMLTVSAIEVLVSRLESMKEAERPKLVVDPVLVATSGSALGDSKICQLIKTKLTKYATLITPNIPESFELIGEKREIADVKAVCELAREVCQETNSPNVLVKGGHIPWGDGREKHITDVLYIRAEDRFIVFNGQYCDTTHTHGTGCTLASAISSNIARGYSLPQAVYGGIEYVQSGVAIGCEVVKSHITTNGPINHVYAIEIPLDKMLSDECFSAESLIPEQTLDKKILGEKDFFEYVIEQPNVKPHWESYVNHEFVRQIAQGTLDPKKFRFFIEQDYAYLIDYARVHCVAASKAPALEDVEKELVIVGSVRHEMQQHEIRLKNDFGVKGNEYFENIKRGPALNNYSRYFNDIARRGNWQELVSSLTPCLMGYGQALLNVEKSITVKEGTPYREWCNVYLSEGYQNAVANGRSIMNQIAYTYPKEQLDTLITIFGEVCELETKFWDAALEFEE